MVVVGTYDGVLVGLSILIAIFASYSALDLAGRVRASAGAARRAWLAASAVAMGGGIWSMHFVAMLAFRLPGMDLGYDPGLTALSFLVAVGVTGAGFAVMSRAARSVWRLLGAGLFMGLGVVSMHYIGMAAMTMDARLGYDPVWVGGSVLIAVGAATASLWLASRNSHRSERVGAAVAMGAAIAGMHYAGMRGALFTVDMSHMPTSTGVGRAGLAAAVSGATFLILLLTLVAAMFDRRFALLAQREAEALRKSEERFRSLYRGTPLPLHSLDREGRLEQVSNIWLELLGYRRDEVIGRPLADFLVEASARQLRQNDWPVLLQQDYLEPREYRIAARTGAVLDVVAAARVERDEAGEFIHVLGGLTDITARKRAEEALLQTQKIEAIGQLTGGLAHDFNNLLAVVLGNLELLGKRLPDNDPMTQKLMTGAMAGAHRGVALTQRLLAFARRQDLHEEPVDVPALVAGAAEMLQRTLGPLVRIRTRFPPALPPAFADSHQLELALLNLVVNARDAMPKGGAIDISAEARFVEPANSYGLEPGRYLCLAVADEGEGMTPEVLARAAEPFFTTKGVGRGTGLGLSMVHGFAAQSGGGLDLKSEPGRGVVAELYLPVSLQAPVGETGGLPKLPSTRPVKPRTVLVVDDDPLVLANTVAMLEDLGHTVLTAGDGPTALDELSQGAPCDIVVTDQLMPGMTGVELAEAVRQGRPGLPVLLVSGFAELQPGDEARGLALLRKPFDQAALVQTIEALCVPAEALPLRPGA